MEEDKSSKPQNFLEEFKNKKSIFLKEEEVEEQPQSSFLKSMPQEAVPVTQEEEIKNSVFNNQAKLYKFEDNNWMDVGMGQMVVTIDCDKKRVSFIREKIKLVALDFFVLYDVRPSLKDKSVTFLKLEEAEDKQEEGEEKSEKEDTQTSKKYQHFIYAARFKNATIAEEFYSYLK